MDDLCLILDLCEVLLCVLDMDCVLLWLVLECGGLCDLVVIWVGLM